MTSLRIIEHDEDPSLAKERKPHWEYNITSTSTEKQRKFPSKSTLEKQQHDDINSTSDWLRHYLIGAPKQVLTDLFLPLGYPHSVGSEYMSYQICDSIQGLCSYLRGVVATSAVLTAAGVGNADATAMSAAMTWAMRDGMGMVGGLTYSYCASSLFDGYVKEFRLFADVINDVGLTLDMLAPYFDAEHVLYVTSTAMICKIMCGISAGATKGSITQHFCMRGNMADLNAKEGTQETLVSLIGMILGIILARHLHELEQTDKAFASTVSWTVFNVLTIVHVWVNYIGVRLLRLRTLNAQRTKEALQQLVATAAKHVDDKDDSWIEPALASILKPEVVCESLFASTLSMLYPHGIIAGARLDKLTAALSLTELEDQLQGEDRYLIGLSGNEIYLSLMIGASDDDKFKAFVHASIVRKCVSCDPATIAAARQCVNRLTAKGFSLSLLESKGWDVKDSLYLGFGRCRLQPFLKSKDD